MELESEPKITKTTSRKKRRDNGLYTQMIINRKVFILMKNIGSNIKAIMLKMINGDIAGKCIKEGYIKPNSISIITHSNGIQESDYIKFDVVIECLVCNPVEGQNISCKVVNITKAGIRASIDDDNNPLVIFIARDHSYLNKNFSNIKDDQEIIVRVIGQRFELNDKNISVIGELVESKNKPQKISISKKSKPVDIDIAQIEESED
jgi:DNA-directed RNA polymerase subunit E'/Rpb7|tara:strand:- start:573 stop:1190 length:618 start_codon:yes stop_codon:yes gene_type:complete